MPVSVGSPTAAANSATQNSATSGAPGPATGTGVVAESEPRRGSTPPGAGPPRRRHEQGAGLPRRRRLPGRPAPARARHWPCRGWWWLPGSWSHSSRTGVRIKGGISRHSQGNRRSEGESRQCGGGFETVAAQPFTASNHRQAGKASSTAPQPLPVATGRRPERPRRPSVAALSTTDHPQPRGVVSTPARWRSLLDHRGSRPPHRPLGFRHGHHRRGEPARRLQGVRRAGHGAGPDRRGAGRTRGGGVRRGDRWENGSSSGTTCGRLRRGWRRRSRAGPTGPAPTRC